MPFASVTHVRLTGADPAAGEQMLREQMIPRLQSQSGFQSARFFRTPDGTAGMGVVVFDTEEHAKAGQDAMANNRPAEAPSITSSAVYEVFMEV
jgi:heme-degrading monooxygenase HmoA